MMGGSGNQSGIVSPDRRIQHLADPEAARIVFDSGMPITMVGIDANVRYAFSTRMTPGDIGDWHKTCQIRGEHPRHAQ